MLIRVISLFSFRCFVACFCSSSEEESESVASWSVIMIRRSFLWVLVLVLHGGLSSKLELGVVNFMGWRLSVECTDMGEECFFFFLVTVCVWGLKG